MRRLPHRAKLYVAVVIAAALACILRGPLGGIDYSTVGLLAFLFVVSESVRIQVGTESNASIAPSSLAALAGVVLVGPVGAAILGVAWCFALTRQEIVKRAFNGAQAALAGYAAGQVFVLLDGTIGVPAGSSFPKILLPFAASAVAYTMVNAALVTGIMLCLGVARFDPRNVRWRPLVTLELSSLAFGTLGLFVAAIWGVVGPFAVALVLVPLFIARWALEQHVAEQKAHEATLATLCQAVETKDFYTRGHCVRVSKASVMIAERLKMPAERVQTVRFAGMLHDVGKLGVPTKVLQKSGALSEEEFAAIQLHPMRGYEIVREIGFLDEALAGIMHHHERMDGRGYPMGLAGTEIPEFARIIAVADAFDCMTSTRSYRKARSTEEAVAELHRCVGSQFDPRMVEAIVEGVRRDGWQPPERVEPPDDEMAEVAQQDHDDPSAPLRVAGENGG